MLTCQQLENQFNKQNLRVRIAASLVLLPAHTIHKQSTELAVMANSSSTRFSSCTLDIVCKRLLKMYLSQVTFFLGVVYPVQPQLVFFCIHENKHVVHIQGGAGCYRQQYSYFTLLFIFFQTDSKKQGYRLKLCLQAFHFSSTFSVNFNSSGCRSEFIVLLLFHTGILY